MKPHVPIAWTKAQINKLEELVAEGWDWPAISPLVGHSAGSCQRRWRALRRQHQSAKNGTRKCSHCREPFHPAHRFNFICPKCSSSDEFREIAGGLDEL
jgi:uncharacterized paraquat-inducible protein A